jgi:parallel beta-helix repeat protein
MKNIFVLWIVCMLVTMSLLGSVSGIVCESTAPRQLNSGTTLYVGGNGTGNYTTIQAAVNAAVDGDTVYVYNDSSPYRESITIDHAITLVGEDEQSTVIEGKGLLRDIISVKAEPVVIHEFTLLNATRHGVAIHTSNNTLYHLTVTDAKASGIFLYQFRTPLVGNTITDNTISGSRLGIHGTLLNGTTIDHNVLFNTTTGIELERSWESNLSVNTLWNNTIGIYSYLCTNITIYGNDIRNNTIGLETDTSSDLVVRNTFINNTHSARFSKFPIYDFVYKTLSPNAHYPTNVFASSKYSGNFWDRSRILPYPIFGMRGVYLDLAATLVSVTGIYPANRIAFDWHPAKQPYPIL